MSLKTCESWLSRRRNKEVTLTELAQELQSYQNQPFINLGAVIGKRNKRHHY